MAGKKFHMLVEFTSTGFSAYEESEGALTTGSTVAELKANAVQALNLALSDTGRTVTEADLVFVYMLDSFFNLYKVLNVSQLAARLGMSQPLLAAYINGDKKPSAKQTQRILEGVRELGKELAAVEFV